MTQLVYHQDMAYMQLSSLGQNNPLIIFDLANNHNGSIDHGKSIISDIAESIKDCGLLAAVKFQYRDLPDYIHKDFQNRLDLKYVNRFLTTQLSWSDFIELKNFASSLGLLTACTPFDELSTKKVIEHGFDILKIASASFTDWSLLESIADWNGPIVASTAGADVAEIDRVVTFLRNRNKDFALMHCVASYPTKDSNLNLGRIIRLKNRYQDIPIGYSTHEDPNNLIAGPMAIAGGAVILERHVGSSSHGQQINAYSSEKNQMGSWIRSLNDAIRMYGQTAPFTVRDETELASLKSLRRHVYAKREISEGESFGVKDVYFAVPGLDSQFTANEFGKYSRFVAREKILVNTPISVENSDVRVEDSKIFAIRDKVLTLLRNSGQVVPNNSELEISHHYGIQNFDKFGSCMITIVNRSYCKKLIFVQAGQIHPKMFHKIKDETFFLLYGDLTLELNESEIFMKEGETVSIPPGAIHGFRSNRGAVVEEVSSTHKSDDSFYIDEEINLNMSRKTVVHYWL